MSLIDAIETINKIINNKKSLHGAVKLQKYAA
jgi:hypothetical protein